MCLKRILMHYKMRTTNAFDLPPLSTFCPPGFSIIKICGFLITKGTYSVFRERRKYGTCSDCVHL